MPVRHAHPTRAAPTPTAPTPAAPTRAARTPACPPAVAALTARQRLFCERLAAGATGAEAARLAGYSGLTAAQQAYKLVQHPQVQAEVERLRLDPALRGRAELDRLLAKVEAVFARALRDGHCGAALRAVELEYQLRRRGAQSLPPDVSPVEIAAAVGAEDSYP